ncbi:hypothetical protein ACA910_019899 [Epithemia clementina (nom. ined.)]
MVKRKTRAKRSLSSLPKGLPVRGGGAGGGSGGKILNDSVNPFDATSRNKRSKHEVVNRATQKVTTQSALARALKERQTKLREELKRSKKSNAFVDGRIGENSETMTVEEQNLARLVKERSRRSKRTSKFSLDDDDDDGNNGGGELLTHKGKAIDLRSAREHVVLSDDEDGDTGQLDAVDTLLHFGGGSNTDRERVNPYGPQDGGGMTHSLAQQYASRKTELDDLIARRKLLKAERVKSKEAQVEAFEKMDDAFDDLAGLLKFRDKEKEIRELIKAQQQGNLPKDDQEMVDWDKEMKQYLFLERKVAATDRTKTKEEIAKEEADRLHKLETRRLARMNGEYAEDDDFSDVSDDDNTFIDHGRDRKRQRQRKRTSPEQLDGDSDDDSDGGHELTTRFTADGLVQVDKNGVVVGKVGEAKASNNNSSQKQLLSVGDRVQACYRANEQFDGQVTWYNGSISKVVRASDGSIRYNVDYDDGDYEDGIEPNHIRALSKDQDELEKEEKQKMQEMALKRKRQKATDKAMAEMPFVFDVPTTLESLHDLIGDHAKNGEEATLLIQRICASNSVRLDRRNTEKMQNFYDVLLRRFIAVGDAIYRSGDGGTELGRYKQLDALTNILYNLAQDSPDTAGAVWARRLGILQSAHAKRLRDAELMQQETGDDDEEISVWPSTGVLLLLRALGHVFPVTDKRHYVVTPALLLLGQYVSHTPVYTKSDLTMGVSCSGLLIEYTREAKRWVPEAHAFLAGLLRLFAAAPRERLGRYPCLNLGSAAEEESLGNLRYLASHAYDAKSGPPTISLEIDTINEDNYASGILHAALSILEVSIRNLAGSVGSAERELFSEVSECVLVLCPKDKTNPLPPVLVEKVARIVGAISETCTFEAPRAPLTRRATTTATQAIESLAPRMENWEKYSVSKDKGKSSNQVALDRTRRELKRERKAISRELRLDAAFIESERREEKSKKDSAAKAARHKAYAWLEGEQATMNQQVAQGGGLLSGGGTGAARAKARSGKIGMKKGGKFSRA